MVCDHDDENPANNQLKNLRVMSQALNNMRIRALLGTC